MLTEQRYEEIRGLTPSVKGNFWHYLSYEKMLSDEFRLSDMTGHQDAVYPLIKALDIRAAIDAEHAHRIIVSNNY